MDEQRVFTFVYRRLGLTTQWEAWHGTCKPWDSTDRWNDRETRSELDESLAVIRVFSDEALDEDDAANAEELADDELMRLFPGHSIRYQREAAAY